MNQRRPEVRLLVKSAVFVGVFCLVSGTAPARGSAGEDTGGGSCTKTGNAAFIACQHDVEDNFWIATGNCQNVSGPHADQVECTKQAEAARDEGKADCGVQLEARLAICESIGEAPYDPKINPAKFVDPGKIGKTIAPNPYFPLVRGRIWTYKGATEAITITVTTQTRKILGVTCAVVHDVVKDNGAVIEDTKDWYAQDIYGNVWYFGEISKTIEDGELVSIDGSWVAGVDHAKPGIIMKLAPAVGNVYRQEFALGNAEDMAEVLSLTGSATVPAASCSGNCVVTKEFQPFTPDAIEHKYYAHGIGMILEVDPATGDRTELVQIKY